MSVYEYMCGYVCVWGICEGMGLVCVCVHAHVQGVVNGWVYVHEYMVCVQLGVYVCVSVGGNSV